MIANKRRDNTRAQQMWVALVLKSQLLKHKKTTKKGKQIKNCSNLKNIMKSLRDPRDLVMLPLVLEMPTGTWQLS